MSDYPEFSQIETDRCTVWRFRQAPVGGAYVTMAVLMLVAVGVPLAELAFAVVVNVTYTDRAEAAVLALGPLFAAQMLFVTGLAVRLGWRSWLNALAYYFGAHELALVGERLFMGRRLGPWRLDCPRPVGELREVVLFLCRNPDDPDPRTACIGVVERAGEGPFPYVMDFPPESGRALAEGLASRLAEVRRTLSRHDPFPPLRVVESTLEEVQNLPLPWRTQSTPFPYWLSRRRWVAITLVGALGLSGLSVAVLSPTGPRPRWALIALFAGWLMEFVFFLMARLPDVNQPPTGVSESQGSRQGVAPPAV